MKKVAIAVFSGAVVFSAAAFADADLIKEKQCFQCHDVSADKIGPSFKKISGQWKGKPDAERTLIATIQKGSVKGGGLHWQMKAEMPNESERPLVSDAEAKRIFRWIMSQ